MLKNSLSNLFISKVLGGAAEHLGGSYDKYNVRDNKDRKWSIVYDSSIRCVDKNGNSASRNYAVELVTPVLEYEDMSLLQEVVRSVRKAGGVVQREQLTGLLQQTGVRIILRYLWLLRSEYCPDNCLHVFPEDFQRQNSLVSSFATS